MPCDHALAEALRAYIHAAGRVEDRTAGCSAPRAGTRGVPYLTRQWLAGRQAPDPPARDNGRHRGAYWLPDFPSTGITACLANGRESRSRPLFGADRTDQSDPPERSRTLPRSKEGRRQMLA